MFHEDPLPSGPQLAVQPSLAVEIDWVLSSASQQRASSPPGLDDVYVRRPDLAERVRNLWGPEETLTYPGNLELSILAHHAGLLFCTDSEALLDGLEAAAADSPGDLPLMSETADDRKGLLRRLEVLRSSAKRRKRYVSVIRDVWAEALPAWEATGRRAVEEAVTDRRAQIAKHPDWHDFTRTDCTAGADLEGMVAALGDDGQITVVPAYFTHKGLVVDLPGLLVIGVRAEPLGVEARARTELIAQRLRAISDPTRMAILSALAHESMTVTEIARTFSLAQPTVSNHVKVLREAGVVANDGSGRTRRIVVQRGVVDELVEQLRDVVGERRRAFLNQGKLARSTLATTAYGRVNNRGVLVAGTSSGPRKISLVEAATPPMSNVKVIDVASVGVVNATPSMSPKSLKLNVIVPPFTESWSAFSSLIPETLVKLPVLIVMLPLNLTRRYTGWLASSTQESPRAPM